MFSLIWRPHCPGPTCNSTGDYFSHFTILKIDFLNEQTILRRSWTVFISYIKILFNSLSVVKENRYGNNYGPFNKQELLLQKKYCLPDDCSRPAEPALLKPFWRLIRRRSRRSCRSWKARNRFRLIRWSLQAACLGLVTLLVVCLALFGLLTASIFSSS